MKKCYRFFGGFIDTQEKWLNKMVSEGYRLVSTGKITYEFEQCKPNEYQYAVEFIAQHGLKSAQNYRSFLEELGYKIFYKNINFNFSFGKVKWRPYGSGTGQISTNPGTYSKELFIIEKRADGKPFELHTTNSDKSNYYKPLRNAWLTITTLFLVLSIWQFITARAYTKEVIVFAILGVLCLVPTIKYQKKITFYYTQSNLVE